MRSFNPEDLRTITNRLICHYANLPTSQPGSQLDFREMSVEVEHHF